MYDLVPHIFLSLGGTKISYLSVARHAYTSIQNNHEKKLKQSLIKDIPGDPLYTYVLVILTALHIMRPGTLNFCLINDNFCFFHCSNGHQIRFFFLLEFIRWLPES